MSTPKSKRKQHPHRQSTKKSRKQPSRHEILTSPANEVQNLLPPEQVKVVTKRGLGLNDYGFQRNASKSIYPYSQIILAPSNAIQYLERSKWSKSIQLLDLSNNDIQTSSQNTDRRRTVTKFIFENVRPPSCLTR